MSEPMKVREGSSCGYFYGVFFICVAWNNVLVVREYVLLVLGAGILAVGTITE